MNQSPRHQCLIYSGAPSQQIPSIALALLEQLNSGFRCLYLNSPAMVSGMRSRLAASGIDLHYHVQRGALTISSDQSHLAQGHFEVDAMIGMLKAEVVRAQDDGFKGFWASGDMTWEFGGEHNLGKLLEYEWKLEELFQETPALRGICQYHMDSLPQSSIREALLVHPAVFMNETLTRVNPHYVPPRTLALEPPATSPVEVTEMLEALGLPQYPIKN